MVFTVRLILVSITVLAFCTSLESAAINPINPEDIKNVTNPEIIKNNTNQLETTTNINEPKTEETTVKLINTNTTDESNQARTENAKSIDFDISKYISPEFHNKTDTTDESNQARTENARLLDFDKSKYRLPELHFKTNTTDESNQAVPENARSLDFDISKYISPEFHNKNNVYNLPTSPENEKFVNTDYLNKHIKNSDTTIKHDFYDKYHNLDNETPIFKPSEVSVEDLIKASKENNANTNLNSLKYTNIINDNDKETQKENRYQFKFDSVYNDSKVYDEKFLEETQPTTIKPEKDDNLIEDKTEEIFVVSKRGSTKFIPTSEKTTSVAQRNIAFKNNLIKNSIPEDVMVDPNEQSVQENVVYPIIVPLVTSQPATTVEMFEVTDANMETTTAFLNLNSNNSNASYTPEVFYEVTTEIPSTTPTPDATTPLVGLETSTTENGLETTSISYNDTKNNVEVTTKNNLVEITTTSMEPPETTSIGNKNNTTDTPIETTTINSAALIENNTTTEATTLEPTTTQSVNETTLSSSDISDEKIVTTIKTDDVETTTISSILDKINSTTQIPVNNNTMIPQNTSSIKTATIPPITTTPLTNPEFKMAPSNNSTENPDIDDENEEFGEDEYNDLQIKKPNQTNDDQEIHAIEALEPDQITPVAPKISDTSIKPVLPTVNPTTILEEVSTEIVQLPSAEDDGGNDPTVIAIIICSVGGICLAALVALLVVVRRRQRRFNYGQRCTPVSLDSYSMDNVSVHNSVRRKARLRGSKRSYGNPAFDDSTVSHTLGFQQLVKFVLNVDEIKSEFEEVPQVTARMNELPDGCDTKNRYANVIPLPESRVFLNAIENDPTSDYINANYVTGPKGVKNYYIACQAPMQNTVDDFWRMIWEQQSKVILMLTHLFENGVEKCSDYLPPSEVLDCHRLFGDYQVTLKKREVKDKYIISSLQLKNMVSNSWREVTHLWYLGWPEKGIPSEENSLIAFMIEARSFVKLVQNNSDTKPRESNSSSIINASNPDVSPVVVHCSPGTGRTGTVIACDIAIREFELKRIVDIPKIVYRIRRDRASSVQTKDQYLFIYKIISLYATKLAGGALDSI